jgi:hypothetical protein
MEKDTRLNEFGLTSEETSKVKDITPSLNLGKLEIGQSVEVEFTSSKPELVAFKDKATGKDKEEYVLKALDVYSGMEVSIWLSAKSLKQQLFNLYTKHGKNLKGVKANISVRPYEHAQWGEVRGYVVQETKGKKA